MTIVLVHAAWHSPWHWHRVRAELSTPTVTVDLPSCDGRRGDMHDDASEIRRVLDEHDEVTVVAHSYSGVPVTEAAAGHPSVRHLVYLAAYNADLDETVAGFLPPDPAEPNVRPDTDLEPTPDGLLRFRPDRAVDVLFHDCPDPRAAVRHMRETNPVVIGQAPRAIAWQQTPSTYAVCTADRATAVSVQRRLATRADHVVEIDSGHSPFLARPRQVADIILAAHSSTTAA
ncbi:alpha/beta fold hydrolase [Ornithinimicrobium cavernae]|uniref:alpha/beta fold hydrolase n=1 Tax=Ornithinimicrobium cavernae TaxID=2666047 RepID=UPI00137B2551|nr:alpha/beta hydrolase [Ornithinimicrobium cavernae]